MTPQDYYDACTHVITRDPFCFHCILEKGYIFTLDGVPWTCMGTIQQL